MDTKNESGYVPSTAHGSEKGWWLRNRHFKKGSLVPQGMQEGGPWRKVVGDLSC